MRVGSIFYYREVLSLVGSSGFGAYMINSHSELDIVLDVMKLVFAILENALKV
jgi:hypothetical protein